MILPGPEAQQLATYIRWMLHGTRGGLAAGILFVLPIYPIKNLNNAIEKKRSECC